MLGIEMHFLSPPASNLVTTVSEIFQIYYAEGTVKEVIENNIFLTQKSFSGCFV